MTYTGESVTIHHITPGGVDAYGDPVAAVTTNETVEDVKVAPHGSEESTERAFDGVTTGWTLYAPTGTTTVFTDQVTVRGVLCRIEGDVATWPSGVVINCVRA